MRRFACVCGARLFFENTRCLACGRGLGYLPETREMRALEPLGDGGLVALPDRRPVRRCANAEPEPICNWLIAEPDPQPWCRSCRLDRTIPNLGPPENVRRWRSLEQAKRRLLYGLDELGLSVEGDPRLGIARLAFEFLEDRRTNPAVPEEHVYTGYRDGVVTLNVAEADPAFRERERTALGQRYRTLLGHFRHESGHYFFEHLRAAGGEDLEEFRRLFGDERDDYAAALERFHAAAPPAPDAWPERYVSAYATMHPLEDWAESWAHVLHVTDTLETAHANGMSACDGLDPDSDHWIAEWRALSVALNELNRSMGLPDAYPFVLTDAVAEKLRFIRGWIRRRAAAPSEPGAGRRTPA